MSRLTSRRLFAVVLAALTAAAPVRAGGFRNDILAGSYDGTLDAIETVNFLVGAGIFYSAGYFGQNTVIANVEAGHVWGGHEVFDRTGLLLPSSPSILINATPHPTESPELGAIDYHATMVGHVLAGTGSLGNGNLSLLGAGMAPFATLWSGAIATRFEHDEEKIGEFEATKESLLVPYRAFFEGSLGTKPDVINSSWGYDDPAGTDEFTRVLDSLAGNNPSVTFVRSAGNGGATMSPGGPGSGFNGITVGSLGGGDDTIPFLRPSTFTASAPSDFFNPATGETISDARAAVSVAAPGEQFALAAYLGKSGSLAEFVGEGDPSTDLYFVFNQSGTSFAAPVVAGGVALLKDVSKNPAYFADQPESRDTRVIKSVIQAGALKTIGWDNGQQLDESGVLVTTQALDYATGAGRLDLETSVAIYLFGTTDVPGSGGGVIASLGWDLGEIGVAESNDYFFDLAFDGPVELAVSLNWFVNDVFDAVAEQALYGSFANLNLEVWAVVGGAFDHPVARSATLYNNSEYLRFVLAGGSYGLRVTHDGMIYDFPGAASRETYGLAWVVVAVPEPAEWAVALALLLAMVVAHRRRARSKV